MFNASAFAEIASMTGVVMPVITVHLIAVLTVITWIGLQHRPPTRPLRRARGRTSSVWYHVVYVDLSVCGPEVIQKRSKTCTFVQNVCAGSKDGNHLLLKLQIAAVNAWNLATLWMARQVRALARQ